MTITRLCRHGSRCRVACHAARLPQGGGALDPVGDPRARACPVVLDDRRCNRLPSLLRKPTLRERWVGPARPRSSAEWRPFAAALSARSAAYGLSVIDALYRWLIERVEGRQVLFCHEPAHFRTCPEDDRVRRSKSVTVSPDQFGLLTFDIDLVDHGWLHDGANLHAARIVEARSSQTRAEKASTDFAQECLGVRIVRTGFESLHGLADRGARSERLGEP